MRWPWTVQPLRLNYDVEHLLETMMQRLSSDQKPCKQYCDLHCLLLPEIKLDSIERFAALLTHVRHEHHERGATLCHHGQHCDSILSICSGVVKLVDSTDEGIQRVILLAGCGDAVCLEALLDEPTAYDVITMEPTDICRVPLSLLREMAETEPKLYLWLMAFWKRNLDYACTCITRFSTGLIPQRLARLILFRAMTDKHRSATEITLFSRPDMAAILGVSQENISRCIAKFCRTKILRKIKRNVYCCDLPKLRDLAG